MKRLLFLEAAAVALLTATVAFPATQASGADYYVRGFGITYERVFPHGKPWPIDLSRARIEIDDRLVTFASDHFKEWRPTPEDVGRLLTRYRVISAKEWMGERSHVAGGDRAGWITLDDGTRLKWMLRPGQLGVVVYPDGGAVYLDGCCAKP
jgi:hypothetical protein